MVKKSFTLIEAIFVIVILAFVLVGGFQIVGKLYVRNYIAKETSKFEFNSQQILDQTSGLLDHRIPLSVIGYDTSDNFKYIGYITDDEAGVYKIIEWIGELSDAKVNTNLSGFIDLYASKKPTLKAVDFNSSFINDVLKNKYDNQNADITNSSAIIFAGSFDRGDEGVLSDYNNSFGWYGNRADYIYKISSYSQNANTCDLNITNYDGSDVGDIKIYEKFYLIDSAYAIARGEDVDLSAECIQNLGIPADEINSTLLLFYNFRPWEGKTFCADKNTNVQKDGNVSVLGMNVSSFYIRKVGEHLELRISLKKQKADINITVSKQKVAF